MRGAASRHWPEPAPCFVGREDERARVAALLRDHPVLVVHGVAGIGKTQLVLRTLAAEHAAGRVPPPAYASVAGAASQRDLVERSARALGQRPPAGRGVAAAATLVRLLAGAPCALVWDEAHEVAGAILDGVLAALTAAPLAARLVLIARAPLPARGPWRDLPAVEVGPLPRREGRRLVEELGAEVLQCAGGNPLLIHLALTHARDVARRGDAGAGLATTVHALLAGPARRPLELLAFAETPLEAADLARVCGRAYGRAAPQLHRYRLLAPAGEALALAPEVAAHVRVALGEAAEATWRALAALGARRLRAAPADVEALLLACRALAHLRRTRPALALLRAHPGVCAAVGAARLERCLRGLAAATPAASGEALALLASELLDWGDVDGALRALDETGRARLSPALGRRRSLLLAEALVRAGDAAAARQEIDRAIASGLAAGDPEFDIRGADLDVFQGQLERARRALAAVAARTGRRPDLEGQRASMMGLSHLYEERFDLALTWALRSRLAYRRWRDSPWVEPLAHAVEVIARLGLGQIRAAAALVAREATVQGGGPEGRPLDRVLRLEVLVASGDFRGCVTPGEALLRELDRRTDRFYYLRTVHDLIRAALGLGQLARAEELVRQSEALAREPAFGAARSTHCFDAAQCADACGRAGEAARLTSQALLLAPRSPYARLDAAAADPAATWPPVLVRRVPAAVRAYAQLRGAEAALAHGRSRDAVAPARAALEWYRRAGCFYELARALLATGEGLAREGERDGATAALDECEAVAAPRGYALVLVAAGLIRGALADRAGALDDYAAALTRAAAVAEGQLIDEAVGSAARRVGVERAAVLAADVRPFGALVERLRLARAGTRLVSQAERLYLLDDVEATPCAPDLEVDLAHGTVALAGAHLDLRRHPLLLRLIEVIVDAGAAGASPEEVHAHLSGAPGFHPLLHRNAVYVAVTRARAYLARLAGGRQLIETVDGRYRVAGRWRAAVARPFVAAAWATGRRQRCAELAGAAVDAAAYARRFHQPLALARWELALAALDPPATKGVHSRGRDISRAALGEEAI
ncbi:MAG TPA: hypothetical protein VGQ83_03295 [Polyangia bacterium]